MQDDPQVAEAVRDAAAKISWPWPPPLGTAAGQAPQRFAAQARVVARTVGLAVGESVVPADSGGDIVVAPIGETTTCIGGVPVWTLALQAFDFARLAAYAGRPLHGILGHRAMTSYVIDLDYRAKTMTLCPPDHDLPSDFWVPLILGPTTMDNLAARSSPPL